MAKEKTVELEASGLHEDLLQVKNAPSDAKERAKIVTRLRSAAKRDFPDKEFPHISQRGEKIYVATSLDGVAALPKGSGRGRKGLNLAELIEKASS